MKLKWLVIMLATFAIVFVQAGLKAPSAYADSLPAIPPVVNGVVEVSTPIQLSYIDINQSQYQSSTIKLMNNLDMTGYTWWGPILNFSGTFDGNGYDISNFTITQSAQVGSSTYMGMFGSTTNTAIIKNLTLSNCNVTGNARNMGALVGLNYGNILHVGIIGGSVHQNGIYFDTFISVGGIAGYSFGADSGVTSGVRDSYSTSDVSGVGYFAFGLMGADNHFNINTSYAAGSLSGNFPYKYGLVNYDSVASYFNKDKITGTTWDSYIKLGTELSSQDMLNQSSFVGWDFQNTWSILPGKTYPFLKGMQSVTPSVLSPAFQNTLYSQKLQIPASSSAPGDLIWQASSLPPGLSLSNDGTLSGTPTSFGSQSFTVVVYSPSTHIVYGSGTISLNITPAPITPLTTVATNPATPNGANGWYTSDITVSLNAVDNGSGISVLKTNYRINGGVWNSYTVPFTLTIDGNYTIDYFSNDKAGNNESVKSVTLKLDKTAPITKYHFDPIYETSSSGIRYIKGYTTTLRATDNVSGSGVKTTQYRINGSTWITYTTPFTFYAGVTHIVEYFSTDNAGNVENPMNVMDFDKGKFTGAGKF